MFCKISIRLSMIDMLLLFVGTIAIFMMIVTSRSYTSLKIILLAILCVISFIEIITKRKKLNPKLFSYLGIFLFYFLLSILIGLLNGFSFSFNSDSALIQYYFITPVVAVLCGTIFYKNYERINIFFNILKYVTLFTVVGNTLKVASLSGWIPDFDFLHLFFVGNVDFINVRTRISNEPALMFLIPMYIYMLFSEVQDKNERFIYRLIVLFGCLYTVLSGRKALELVMGITFIIVIISNVGKITRKKLSIILSMIVSIIIFYFVLKKVSVAMGITNVVDTAFNAFLRGLNRNSGGTASRINNIRALFNMFLSSPIWGHGITSYAVESYASTSTHWSYEVYYNALLAQIGLCGLFILLFGFYSILKKLLYLARLYSDKRLKGWMIGLIMFLICCATNPIIAQVWIWIISVGLCFVCAYEHQPKNYEM